MIELEFCELHGPIFLRGTNLPAKLIPGDAPGQRRDIKLFYDRDHREVHVHFKDKVAIVPRENVASMVAKAQSALADSLRCGAQKEKSAIHSKPAAQVETPLSHVFMGTGHGKTHNKDR